MKLCGVTRNTIKIIDYLEATKMEEVTVLSQTFDYADYNSLSNDMGVCFKTSFNCEVNSI